MNAFDIHPPRFVRQASIEWSWPPIDGDDMTEQLDLASTVVGYAGAAVIALAYLANQGGRLRSEDWRFPGLNLLGSGCVLLSLAVHPNAPSIAIEAFWAAISVYGLGRSLRGRGTAGR